MCLATRRLRHFSFSTEIGTDLIHDSESANEFRLSLVLKDQQKLFLGQTSDSNTIIEAAEEIADLIDVSIHKK